MSDAFLDARGMTCPLPILRARRMLKSVPDGGCLTVTATDPSTVRDFQAFCKQTGHQLVESREDVDGLFHYVIRKA